MKKDLISIGDLSREDLTGILQLTAKLKKDGAAYSHALAGRTIALIFQKPSNRTRVSFEVGVYQLGGNSIYLGPDEINLGVRESTSDVARTLSRYVNGMVLRTFAHQTVLDMAQAASVAVINGLSDFSHPCQALADVYTIKEKLGDSAKVLLAYVGDGNNVCNSLLYASAKSGIDMNIAVPKGYEPDKKVFESAQEAARADQHAINMFHDPAEAVKGADVVYTDVWASMGQESEAEKRQKVFRDFQVNRRLMSLAKKGALVMHCLPAHRGLEIAEEVIDSPSSIVFDQAENRMHVEKAVLIKLLGS